MAGWEAAGSAGLVLVRQAPQLRLRESPLQAPAEEPAALLAVVETGGRESGRVDLSPDGKGRLWVSKSAIPKGTLVESAQCAYLKKSEAAHLGSLWIVKTAFRCKRTEGVLLPCSPAVFVGESDDPNLEIRVDEANLIVRYYARRDISCDETLTICASSDTRTRKQ